MAKNKLSSKNGKCLRSTWKRYARPCSPSWTSSTYTLTSASSRLPILRRRSVSTSSFLCALSYWRWFQKPSQCITSSVFFRTRRPKVWTRIRFKTKTSRIQLFMTKTEEEKWCFVLSLTQSLEARLSALTSSTTRSTRPKSTWVSQNSWQKICHNSWSRLFISSSLTAGFKTQTLWFISASSLRFFPATVASCLGQLYIYTSLNGSMHSNARSSWSLEMSRLKTMALSISNGWCLPTLTCSAWNSQAHKANTFISTRSVSQKLKTWWNNFRWKAQHLSKL